jgi:chromosome segregation ATPase
MADAAQSDERLVQINSELNHILEERITFLTSTLKSTEKLSAQIASTEIDIKRNREMQGKLQDEMKDIGKELDSLTSATEQLSTQRDSKQKDKYAKEKEIQRLEWEIAEKGKEIENDDDKIKNLESELARIERENKKLKNRVKVLEEGVERMRKVRQEYMRSIKDLNKEMTGLASNPEEGEEEVGDEDL